MRIEDVDLQGIKAVVFDLDGTLYSKRLLALRLVLGDMKDIRLLASERRARRELRGMDFGDADEFYKALFEETARRGNVHYMTVKEWYVGKYMPMTVEILSKHYKAREWVETMLRQLRERGIQTVVLSDYGCVNEKLVAIGLKTEWFDYKLSAPELGGLKPNKRVYERLLEVMGVKAEEVLIAGDREDTDGVGARETSMRFVLVES